MRATFSPAYFFYVSAHFQKSLRQNGKYTRPDREKRCQRLDCVFTLSPKVSLTHISKLSLNVQQELSGTLRFSIGNTSSQQGKTCAPCAVEEKEDAISPFVQWPTCVWSIQMQTKTTANGVRWTQRSIIVSQCGSFSSKEAMCTKIPWRYCFLSHQSGISGWPTKPDKNMKISLNFVGWFIIKRSYRAFTGSAQDTIIQIIFMITPDNMSHSTKTEEV